MDKIMKIIENKKLIILFLIIYFIKKLNKVEKCHVTLIDQN